MSERNVSPPSPREKILVALSGGVDSSVAALLLKQAGHDVSAAYMKNWINEDGVIGDCPWKEDIEDARRVADRIGIPFEVVNLMRDYRERVVHYLLAGYAEGLTPNPDVVCNREMKFGVFRAWAKENGFAAVATGHYARTSPRTGTVPRPIDSTGKQPSAPVDLLEGVDGNKDQSYFLALLRQDQVRDARFPLGELTKPQVRDLARAAGLPTADKKDSQGICFIGQVRMQDFLRAYVPDHPGPIVRATDGLTLGEHRGLHLYTLGQRRGIRVPSNTDHERYVVVQKRAADNALVVAFDRPDAPGLFQTEVRIHSLSWIGEEVSGAGSGAARGPAIPSTTKAGPIALEGRVRYRDSRVPLEFIPEGGGTARVRFATPQRALAAGQILALHDGERLLGGGIFDAVAP